MACAGQSSLDGAPLEGFSPDQRAYLEGLLEQLDLTTVFKPAPAAGAAAVSVHGTPLEDLCSQEKWKLERPPGEWWPTLAEHAAADRMPEGGDVFMFKHQGLFNVQPAQPGFMCRLRIPACKMTADQLGGLGSLAESIAGGYAHVTTRGNLQLREIPAKHILTLLETLADLGLTSKGAGADSVRNITCNPTAGFDPQELVDLSPLGVRLHHAILNTPSLHGIPRKFNIAFDGGGVISPLADTNDLGFAACKLTDAYLAQHPEVAERAPDGVVLRILLGGITGHGDFAISSGFACYVDDAIAYALGVLRLFIEEGDRTNRKKARFKYVLDARGHEAVTLDAESRSGVALLRLPEAATEPRGPIDRAGHIGVHPAAQSHQSYVGVALPAGRLSAEQMGGLAELSRMYCGGDVRLTVWQNLLLPGVAEGDIAAVVAGVRALGLDVKASSFATGVVACTGKFACQYASAHTKESGVSLVKHLEERHELDRPINIHLTGCSHSCAQHYIGDIGLLGASTADGREAFQVYLGGGADQDQGLARRLTGPIASDDLNEFLDGVLSAYQDRRAPGESFLDFTRRLDDDALQQAFAEPVAAWGPDAATSAPSAPTLEALEATP
ncbi:MAG: NirA family protein [Planctomycetota bacterium]